MPPEVTLLEIPPCQIPMCGVAYSCSYVLLLLFLCICYALLLIMLIAFHTVITVPAEMSRGHFRKSYRNSFCKTSLLHCGKIYGSELADLNVRRRLRARCLRSAAGSMAGRHILESRCACAERCANDEFLTSFRATVLTQNSYHKMTMMTQTLKK